MSDGEYGGFDKTPTLEGASVRLRPLVAGDFEALYAAAADPLLWAQHPDPLRYRRDVFERNYFAAALADGALVVTDRGDGAVLGSSRYYDFDAAKREVAIGYTFLVRARWGGATNGEVKRLMLEHAFRRVDRVWFHVGVDNLRSRRALEKIGATFSHEAAHGLGGVQRVSAFYQIRKPPEARD